MKEWGIILGAIALWLSGVFVGVAVTEDHNKAALEHIAELNQDCHEKLDTWRQYGIKTGMYGSRK